MIYRRRKENKVEFLLTYGNITYPKNNLNKYMCNHLDKYEYILDQYHMVSLNIDQWMNNLDLNIHNYLDHYCLMVHIEFHGNIESIDMN